VTIKYLRRLVVCVSAYARRRRSRVLSPLYLDSSIFHVLVRAMLLAI